MLDRKKAAYICGGIIFLVFFYILFLSAPGDFSYGATVEVQPGMSLRSISLLLQKERIIRSRTAFESFVILFGGELHIPQAGYVFEAKLPVYEVAWRIASGEHHMPPLSVTIPEGYNSVQIADTFTSRLANFNKTRFLAAARTKEGYLFPDTYFFLATDSDTDVLKSMSDNFDKKITPLLPEIAASGKTERDIITMASVIEREAKGDTDRAVIAGILWKRIAIGMRLEVDAVPETYKAGGLPKSPIDNPGLLAVKAAIHPENSPYLYYLHDTNGTIHYAKTFAEHKLNEEKYLK